MTSWRHSRVVAVLAVTLFLALQLLLPVTRTVSGEKGRFAWQMFSLASDPIEFVVHFPDYSKVIDIHDITARYRNELPLEDVVAPFACETMSDAVAVTWDGQRHEC